MKTEISSPDSIPKCNFLFDSAPDCVDVVGFSGIVLPALEGAPVPNAEVCVDTRELLLVNELTTGGSTDTEVLLATVPPDGGRLVMVDCDTPD